MFRSDSVGGEEDQKVRQCLGVKRTKRSDSVGGLWEEGGVVDSVREGWTWHRNASERRQGEWEDEREKKSVTH